MGKSPLGSLPKCRSGFNLEFLVQLECKETQELGIWTWEKFPGDSDAVSWEPHFENLLQSQGRCVFS